MHRPTRRWLAASALLLASCCIDAVASTSLSQCSPTRALAMLHSLGCETALHGDDTNRRGACCLSLAQLASGQCFCNEAPSGAVHHTHPSVNAQGERLMHLVAAASGQCGVHVPLGAKCMPLSEHHAAAATESAPMLAHLHVLHGAAFNSVHSATCAEPRRSVLELVDAERHDAERHNEGRFVHNERHDGHQRRDGRHEDHLEHGRHLLGHSHRGGGSSADVEVNTLSVASVASPGSLLSSAYGGTASGSTSQCSPTEVLAPFTEDGLKCAALGDMTVPNATFTNKCCDVLKSLTARRCLCAPEFVGLLNMVADNLVTVKAVTPLACGFRLMVGPECLKSPPPPSPPPPKPPRCVAGGGIRGVHPDNSSARLHAALPRHRLRHRRRHRRHQARRRRHGLPRPARRLPARHRRRRRRVRRRQSACTRIRPCGGAACMQQTRHLMRLPLTIRPPPPPSPPPPRPPKPPRPPPPAPPPPGPPVQAFSRMLSLASPLSVPVSLCPGQTLVASSCTSSGEDTVISIADASSNTIVAQDDDGCGAPGGQPGSLGASVTYSPSASDFLRAGSSVLAVVVNGVCYTGVSCSASVAWTIQGPGCSTSG